MLKKTCPNGHVYDQSIYGDTCPLCPPPSNNGTDVASNMTMLAQEPPSTAAHTKVIQSPGSSVQGGGMPINGFPHMQVQQDATGPTRVSPKLKQPGMQPMPNPGSTARTTIRRNPALAGQIRQGVEGRKLVGFLVTYNRTPMGKAYNVYEGRNYIGRDASCDISIPDDNQMSGKHMLIRYLSGNNKFSFKDEMSSNGTYVNKELLDEGELQNYDIIRVGSTIFIFIAIPQI